MSTDKPAAVKVELKDGTVANPKVYSERTETTVVKLLRVISILRTPKTLMARMALNTRAGLYALEIDEPTVRAMVKVFDDFHAEHPDGKAPPPPPRWDPANALKPVDLEP
jgi:hypothetical protein